MCLDKWSWDIGVVVNWVVVVIGVVVNWDVMMTATWSP